MHTKERIQEAIKGISELSDDQLIHYYKIISSKHTKAEKALYEPLRKAIESERKSRGATSTISSKIVSAEPKKKKSIADSYEE